MKQAETGAGQGLSFALTLAARLCHDLAGTMGALAGTLELAVEAPDPEALAIALSCAQETSARLRLLRAAWSENAEVPDLSTLVGGLPGAERLTADLSGMPPGLPDAQRRLAANLLLLAAASLPRGGDIRIEGNAGAMSVDIDGPRAGWPDCLNACLQDPAALHAACARTREVAVAVTCLLAQRLGLRITLPGTTRLIASRD